MKILFAFILLSVSAGAIADGVPQEISLTPELANKLGFRLVAMDTGHSKERGFRFWFPPKIGGCSAARAQASLSNLHGKQLSVVSADYIVKDGPVRPRLLFTYRPAMSDMYIDVQYCCATKVISDCRKAYTIKSVSRYLSHEGS